MTEILQDITGFSQNFLLVGFLVFLRVGSAMALLPIVGEQSIPQRVRLVLALAFTAIVAPAVWTKFPIVGGLGTKIAVVAIIEIATGLAIGMALRLFVYALQVAGSIAAQTTSLSQIFGGAGVDPQAAIGHLLLVAGLALAVSYGLHVQAASLLIYSYDVIQPGIFVSKDVFTEWGVLQIARAFALAFSLAAPFLVASLIYNIALGVINRAMPQLMVSFVGAPAITAGGLALLMVAAPLMLDTWMNAINGFLSNPFETVP